VVRFERVLEGGELLVVARAKCNCGAVYEARREVSPLISLWALGVLESSMVER
jgi:hypothetical protein